MPEYIVGPDPVTTIDQEVRDLVSVYHQARIKIGLELAKRLKKIDEEKIYKKLDETSYPSFKRYLDSIGINYKTAREIIGVYETFVLAGGKTIDQLAKIGYHRLTTIKPYLFEKQDGQYVLVKPQEELDQLLSDAESDITTDDLMQARRDKEVGPHEHDFSEIHYRQCKLCRLKEYYGGEKR